MPREVHTARLQKIEDLREDILKAGDEAQELKKLPDWIVTKLVDEGFFRFALPTEMGGDNASSMETIEDPGAYGCHRCIGCLECHARLRD